LCSASYGGYNVTPIAFAADRRAVVCPAAAVSCCWAPAVQQSVDTLYILSAGPTEANPPHAAAAVDSWDRQTDGQTDGHRTVT